jgi:hypothetical protein
LMLYHTSLILFLFLKTHFSLLHFG